MQPAFDSDLNNQKIYYLPVKKLNEFFQQTVSGHFWQNFFNHSECGDLRVLRSAFFIIKSWLLARSINLNEYIEKILGNSKKFFFQFFSLISSSSQKLGPGGAKIEANDPLRHVSIYQKKKAEAFWQTWKTLIDILLNTLHNVPGKTQGLGKKMKSMLSCWKMTVNENFWKSRVPKKLQWIDISQLLI